MIRFDSYKKCLLNGEVILKSQQRFISKKQDVYTENINKIALSNNYDKRLAKLQVIHMNVKVKMCWFNNILKNKGSNNPKGIGGST